MALDDQPQAGSEDEDRLLCGWKPRKDDAGRFSTARNGDDLMCPFECDNCVFGKLYDHEPNVIGSSQDAFAMACIRRVILDAFWSRARPTVTANALKVREGLRISERMGMKGPYENPGPLPSFDHCGYEVAIQMVASSLEKGRYSESHKQWDTIRRLRSCYSNQIRAAKEANSNPIVLADTSGKLYQRIARDACGSLWFARFAEGCQKRMGQDWRPNQAISNELMHKLLSKVEERVRTSTSIREKEKWIMCGAYFCFCYVLSLRSPEGLMADLEGLIKFHDDTCEDVIIPLLGRFKGEHHAKQHLISSKGITGSGIQVKQWIRRLMAVHRVQGRSTGPAFVNKDGYQSTTSEMNDLFLLLLVEIYDECPSLFGLDVTQSSDLEEKYHVFRSFRRGSESRAVAMQVSASDRYQVNRWKKKEASGSKKAGHVIDQYYVDVTLVKAAFLRYTDAM